MIKYIKQDKDNNPLKVIIKPNQVIHSIVNINLYKIYTINLFLFKFNIRERKLSICKETTELEGYSCEHYEHLANKLVIEYNRLLTMRENDNEVLNFIRKGCK